MNDITAHDTRSTMKLLWAAVVVVTLVEAVDKDTFYKMTDFYKFERNPTKKNLFYYLRASSKLYLDYISQLISIFAEVTPEKPEFFAKEKEILNKISQLMTDKNIMKAIDHFYPVSEHEDEEVSLIEIDRWRKVTQAGERFMNKFLDFSHSDYHKHLPLFELVPRPTPKSASLESDWDLPAKRDVYKFMRLVSEVLRGAESAARTFRLYLLRNYPLSRERRTRKESIQFLKNYVDTLSKYIKEYRKFFPTHDSHIYSKDAKEILRLKSRVFDNLEYGARDVKRITMALYSIRRSLGDMFERKTRKYHPGKKFSGGIYSP
ncbi:hypothetical protein GE061_017210 [Apolygus lucorum]|uniref:Uncharacterized protein n=1 Tax=Apolygus lucorum TaxID=248454 RepID=A0A8S9XD32_APOLU|nr:hypothetical protein GE061_017210 [Apolygus lucorum]